MSSRLYKQAYTSVLTGRFVKQADVSDAVGNVLSGGKYYLALKFLPAVIAAMGTGVAGGYILNRLSRHSDPTIADSNTTSDIDRVERLKKIKYYNALANQLDSDKSIKSKKKEDVWP